MPPLQSHADARQTLPVRQGAHYRSCFGSHHKVHAVLGNFPSRLFHLAPLSRVFVENGIRIVDVSIDFSDRKIAKPREAAPASRNRQMTHRRRGPRTSAAKFHLILRPEAAVEQQTVAVRSRRDK